jgi:hypothetical protein
MEVKKVKIIRQIFSLANNPKHRYLDREHSAERRRPMMRTMILIPLTAALAAAVCAQNELTLVGQWFGEGYDNYFGQATTMGDFDGDGKEEFIAGAWGWNMNTGKNYFFQFDEDWPSEPYMTVQGDTFYEQYDYSDANLGDISGDGIPDLGIPVANRGPLDYGRLDIFLGSTEFDTIPDWAIVPGVPIAGFAFDLDSCGDVNGDGYNDLETVDLF